MNILFCCSYGMSRSPTGSKLVPNSKYLGLSTEVLNGIEELIAALEWADLVYVFENWHYNLVSRYIDKHKVLVNLDIPDEYIPDDPVLIELIKERMFERTPKLHNRPKS